jgi:hypothetical protein
MRRTTIALEERLFKEVKRLAVDSDRTIQQIVSEALQRYLGLSFSKAGVPAAKKDPFLGVKEVDLGDPNLSTHVDDILYGPSD